MYRIRSLNCIDVKSVREIFYDFFHVEERSNFHFTWRVREKARSVGIFTQEGDLVGFTLVWSNKLAYIVVDRELQGKNLGSALLSYILQMTIHLRKSLSLTPVNATRLIDWYKKHGFKEELATKSDIPGVPFRILSFHSYGTRAHSKALSQYTIRK